MDLNAEKNSIRTGTVPGTDRTSSGTPGRRARCKPSINHRPTRIDREETIDVTVCPDGHRLSGKVVDSYTKVTRVTIVLNENVEYTINRRWRPVCKKIISTQLPGIRKHARRSANHQATLVSLHMNGPSHGKAAEFSGDALKCTVPRSTSYRDEMALSGRLAPEHDDIAKKILSEPFRHSVQLWWPVSGSNDGAATVVLGEKACLVRVVESATIKRVREMLSGYQRTVIQDSKTTWLRVGSDRQLCMWHRHRLCKKDLKYVSLKGDALRFVSAMDRTTPDHYRADKITNPHPRNVAARCLDRIRSGLIHHPWARSAADGRAAGPRVARAAGWTRTAARQSTDISKDTAVRATFTPPTHTIRKSTRATTPSNA